MEGFPTVLTPADFATLQNTLGPMGVLTQMEAERVSQAQQMAQRTRQAQESAGQAGQAYQEAAGAPPPQVAPGEEFLNTLTGGIASTLQGNQGAAQRANQRTRDTRSALMQARADNLQALRDQWKNKADLAEKVGDIEESINARSKYEQLSKTFDQLQKTQGFAVQEARDRAERAHDIEMEKLRARNAQSLAKTKADEITYSADEVQAAADDLAEGRTQIQNVPVEKGFRRAVQSHLRSSGRRIMPIKVREALSEVSAAETVVNEIAAISQQVNTAKADLLSRGITGLKNVGDSLNQQGMAASLEAARKGLAGNLARAISAERGVMTNQDRNYAMGLVPTLFDSEQRAAEKIEMLKRFITAKRENAIRVYTTVGGGTYPAPDNATGKADPLGIR
jgi:hypothetical protein